MLSNIRKYSILPNMSNKFLFWSLIVLNILDVLLTARILSLGGSEMNPWPNFLIAQFGISGMVVGKAIPLIGFGIILYNYWDRIRLQWQVDVHNMLIMVNLAYAAIVFYSVSLNISLL